MNPHRDMCFRSYSQYRDTSNIWTLITLLPYYLETACLSYPRPVSPSVVCDHRLSSRMAIFSSLFSSLPTFFHVTLVMLLHLLLQHIAFLDVYYTFLLSINVPHARAHMCIHVLLSRSQQLVNLFLRLGRSWSLARNRSFSVFA